MKSSRTLKSDGAWSVGGDLMRRVGMTCDDQLNCQMNSRSLTSRSLNSMSFAGFSS